MASTLSHAALFAAGVFIGAGTMVYTTHKSSNQDNALAHPNHNPQSPQNLIQNQPPRQHFFSTPTVPVPIQNRSSISDILKFGHPGPISDFFSREAYAIGYDRRTRNPSWTAEHLTSENLKPNKTSGKPGDDDAPDRSHSTFREDVALPEQFRAKLHDYFRSGYDRGHMVPAADAKRSQAAMDQTFLLSNIAPQVGEGFNRDYWAHLENFVRQLTHSFQDVYVFTLPMYLPKQDPVTKKHFINYEVIGNPPNVAVPTHFAKVVYAIGGKADPSGKGSLGSFVLPNAKISNEIPLVQFDAPIESIERSTGLILLPETIKQTQNKLCSTVKCDMVIRNFDNMKKQIK
ncbi:hypothetical protein O181_033285 [Austropuccinia psidii MF-1]|uniref:Endonuclease n=1 Tax=Austropuccinia psidii MF-1 TaxID=1389203 RepID=A0A9Q3H929_9BASI|nr:hypothetical protein [Austropuccinia psidii MF-1]